MDTTPGSYPQSPLQYGYYKIDGCYSISAGIRKNLWNYKASLSLFVDDIFDSQHNHTVSERNGQRIEMNNTWSSRQVRLSFSYYFRSMTGKSREGKAMEASGRL